MNVLAWVLWALSAGPIVGIDHEAKSPTFTVTPHIIIAEEEEPQLGVPQPQPCALPVAQAAAAPACARNTPQSFAAPAASPPPRGMCSAARAPQKSRAEHLQAAADHLVAAGEFAQARKLKELAQRDALKHRYLELKLAELAKLQAEVRHLQSELGVGLQIMMHCKLYELKSGCPAAAAMPNRSSSFVANQDDARLIERWLKAAGARALAEPTLATVSGRPVYFHVGGEMPILIPQGRGTVSVDFLKFGTILDGVSTFRQGKFTGHLDFRQVDLIQSPEGQKAGDQPTFHTRRVSMGVELKPGQTIVVRGLRRRAPGCDQACDNACEKACHKSADKACRRGADKECPSACDAAKDDCPGECDDRVAENCSAQPACKKACGANAAGHDGVKEDGARELLLMVRYELVEPEMADSLPGKAQPTSRR